MKVKITLVIREAFYSKKRVAIADVEHSMETISLMFKDLIKSMPYFTSFEIKVTPLRPKELEIYQLARGD